VAKQVEKLRSVKIGTVSNFLSNAGRVCRHLNSHTHTHRERERERERGISIYSDEEQFVHFWGKVAKTVAKPKKCPNIYTVPQFESPKHLHQTILKPKYASNKPIFKLFIKVRILKIYP
jgi:hypothetical protein